MDCPADQIRIPTLAVFGCFGTSAIPVAAVAVLVAVWLRVAVRDREGERVSVRLWVVVGERLAVVVGVRLLVRVAEPVCHGAPGNLVTAVPPVQKKFQYFFGKQINIVRCANMRIDCIQPG